MLLNTIDISQSFMKTQKRILEKGQQKKVVTTTIAALIAVTILHDETESPEDKLIDMIEASGEAEVMDSSDALDMLGEVEQHQAQEDDIKTPTNDND